MENKQGKFFVTEALKKCKFMPKMHQNTFGGRAPPDPLGEVKRSSSPLAAIKGSYF